MISTVLVLPSPPALLPRRTATDPVGPLRHACATALAALPVEDPIVVLAAPVSEANRARGVTEPLGHRVAAHLLGDTGFEPLTATPDTAERLLGRDGRAGRAGRAGSTTLLVMADGSARRDEKAPGHVHPGAVAFDARIEEALREGDPEALATLEPALGEELWCEGVPGLRVLGEVARGRTVRTHLSYADAPYGVAWWVARWDIGAPDSRR